MCQWVGHHGTDSPKHTQNSKVQYSLMQSSTVLILLLDGLQNLYCALRHSPANTALTLDCSISMVSALLRRTLSGSTLSPSSLVERTRITWWAPNSICTRSNTHVNMQLTLNCTGLSNSDLYGIPNAAYHKSIYACSRCIPIDCVHAPISRCRTCLSLPLRPAVSIATSCDVILPSRSGRGPSKNACSRGSLQQQGTQAGIVMA